MLLRPQAVIFVLVGVVVNCVAAGFRSIVAPPVSATCDKFVHCTDGNEVFLNGTETGDSCHDACTTAGGNCCTDPLDCNGFTGSVCADAGQLSCSTVNGTVVPGCDLTNASCVYAGACENATIFRVADSCAGPYSCKLAGNNGNVGDTTNSCRGYAACVFMASKSGTVGHLTDSCNGTDACKYMAYDGGDVGPVKNSCNEDDACLLMASEGGRVGSVSNSCNEDEACLLMASEGGRVGSVSNSCNGLDACFDTADQSGTIASLTNSCNNGSACSFMAGNGTIGPVTGSCNGAKGCFNTAIGQNGTIASLTDSCNNGIRACADMANEGSIGDMAYSCNARGACERVQCKGAFCDSSSTSPGIDFMNGSCNTEGGCYGYMGDADGSGLTCTAHSTAPVTFSSDTTTCTDTDSEEVSTCDGTTDVCTSLCPAGDAYIPINYWVPPLDKPGMTCEAVRLKIPDHGEFSCLPIGEGICRDNGGAFGEWRFGIEVVETPPCEVTSKCRTDTETNTFPVLIDPANTRYPITGTTFTNRETGKVCKNGLDEAIRGCNYAGTTHICISENIESDPNRYSDERPYMFFYDEKSHQYLYQLVCDGIGEEGKLPELKMVNNEDLADATYVNYPVDIVKFKKGATPNKDDANELWKMYMDWNGFEDPDTRRIGKLASFIGVAHPNLCKEYVSATDKPCWKEDCNDVTPPIETPEDYERSNCDLI